MELQNKLKKNLLTQVKKFTQVNCGKTMFDVYLNPEIEKHLSSYKVAL